MWAFDGTQCVPFTYGGCGGNLNRFFTQDQCKQTCEEKTVLTSSSTTTSMPKFIIKTKSACQKPRIGSSITCGSGVRLSKFYYYNSDNDSCEAEIGCPVPLEDTSRGNRFFSKISCLKLCQRNDQVANCQMAPSSGDCDTFKQRYYYNRIIGRCLHFNYSGCGGNNNNFESFLSCQDSCSGASKIHLTSVAKCQLPQDLGEYLSSFRLNFPWGYIFFYYRNVLPPRQERRQILL